MAVLLGGCQRSPYPGFKRIEEGIDIRLHALGDGDRTPSGGDRVLMRVRLAHWNGEPGSLFSTERWYALEKDRSFLSRVFGRMHEGDSMSVIALAGRIPWEVIAPELKALPADTQRIRMELSLRELAGPGDVPPVDPVPPTVDPEARERDLLAPYRDTPGWISWGGELFYRIDDAGSDTAAIRTGDVVTLDYVGRFMDGRVFDDTRRSGQPIVFRLGDPGQVIKGLEIAVHLLHPGGRGTFIVPSALAFGEGGSSSGIVPPHTPVEYVVIVHDVPREHAPTPIP